MFVTLVSASMLTGCATQKLNPNVKDDIPVGANRVVLNASPDMLNTTDLTKAELFRRAVTALQEKGYDVNAADFDQYILTTEPRQVRDDLAVKVDLNVVEKDVNGGPEVIASAQWAPSKMTAAGNWQEANWSDGRAKAAFTDVVDALSEVQDTIIYTETELGVTERGTSR